MGKVRIRELVSFGVGIIVALCLVANASTADARCGCKPTEVKAVHRPGGRACVGNHAVAVTTCLGEARAGAYGVAVAMHGGDASTKPGGVSVVRAWNCRGRAHANNEGVSVLMGTAGTLNSAGHGALGVGLPGRNGTGLQYIIGHGKLVGGKPGTIPGIIIIREDLWSKDGKSRRGYNWHVYQAEGDEWNHVQAPKYVKGNTWQTWK